MREAISNWVRYVSFVIFLRYQKELWEKKAMFFFSMSLKQIVFTVIAMWIVSKAHGEVIFLLALSCQYHQTHLLPEPQKSV